MKKLYIYLFLIGLTAHVYAQPDHIDVSYTTTAPVIDGMADDVWTEVDAVSIENAFQSEQPTVTAYWKALWDDDFLYVLIYVEDDDHWPSWESGGSWYEYDQPEVYLDINSVLEDENGPGGKGNGHYQTLSSFSSGGEGVKTDLEESNYRPGGSFCYTLSGENYTMEYALDYESFVDIDGFTMSIYDFVDMERIGFDVTIIDQDEGVTTSRQRAVWQNTGEQDESYVNMDDAGTIKLVDGSSAISKNSVNTLSVYPNPAKDKVYIKAEFDKVTFTNLTGQIVLTSHSSEKTISTKDLSCGLYMVQVFKADQLVGTKRILKQ